MFSYFVSNFFYSILTSQRTVCRLYTLFISHTQRFRVGRGGGRRPSQTNKQFNHTSGYTVISRTSRTTPNIQRRLTC